MKAKRLEELFEYLPQRLVRELRCVMRGSGYEVRELRLRSRGISTLVCDGGSFPILTRVGVDELERTVESLCRGSLYAHREEMREGYISLPHGVRVGVVGEARYDGGRLVGIHGVSSLSFRIPTGRCSFGDELYRGWQSLSGENLLLIAPPSCGKTTALRALAGMIGRGRDARRVVVVDERCEFDPEDYGDATVDILQGYRRGLGTEVAVRTMSPEVLIVDEIASERDAAAVRSAVGVGVSLIATAHGTDPVSASRRGYIRELFADGCFRHFCRVERCGTGFSVTEPMAVCL